MSNDQAVAEYRVLVTGSRTWADWERVWHELAENAGIPTVRIEVP